MTILKLQKDSPRSGEHSRCLQSILGVSRKNFRTRFQKSYFFEKAFFHGKGIWPIFVYHKKKLFRKNMIFENVSKIFF